MGNITFTGQLEKPLPITDFYRELSDTPLRLRDHIAKECGVAVATVYRWLNGTSVPRKSDREKIASILNRPVYELWPDLKELQEEEV
ncbi:helix-turn-helix domain-containing protein [Parabacteroides merdae]|uniref:helix-turn-helix domain-containing protein n=1 Tax=Parabacteroides merdae TaxID=46503 RepID=UPI003DA29093